MPSSCDTPPRRKRLSREPALMDAVPRPSGGRFAAAATFVVGNALGNDGPIATAQTPSNCTKQRVFTGAARIGEALGAGGRKPALRTVRW